MVRDCEIFKFMKITIYEKIVIVQNLIRCCVLLKVCKNKSTLYSNFRNNIILM